MKIKAASLCIGFALMLSVASAAQYDMTKVADAKPGDVRVIASGAVELPLKKVVMQAQAAIGKPLIVQYGGSQLLRDDILHGQEFEVVLLLPAVNNELRAAGKIGPDSYPLAHVPIGFGLRGDVPSPDMATPAAVKAAFLKAKSIKYAPTGAALATVRNVLKQLDLTGKIQDSSALKTPVPLTAGEYEITIYPVTEILASKELRNLGPVIPELQVPVVVEAAIGSKANDSKAALALIQYLQGPQFASALQEVGLKPIASGK